MPERILVVDRETRLQEIYQRELESEGYEVLIAIDGDRAVDEMASREVDLVVVDLEVPGENGFTLLEHLLLLNRNAKLVINTCCPRYKLDFHSWAADAYLTKSVDIRSSDLQKLKSTIDRLLHHSRN